MISYLEGVLAEKVPTRVVLDVRGVGYEALIHLSSFDRLPAVGQPCRLVTHLHVREDAHVLYGFITAAEKSMFLLLIAASGIGPKLALSALSGMTVRELRAAICDGDVKRLSTISGVGRRTAERLVVELKDKISPAEALEALAGAAQLGVDDARLRDALMALIALGYKQENARQMLDGVIRQQAGGELPDTEKMIKQALSGAAKQTGKGSNDGDAASE